MELTPDDRLFLQTICRYFHENGEWPTLHWLERDFLSHKDIDVLELEYRIQREINDTRFPRSPWDPNRRIKLTVSTLGFCLAQNLCPEIREDLDAFISVVRLCVSKYYDAIEPFTITDSELRDTLAMSEIMSRKVFLLTESDFNIRGTSGYTPNEQGQITNWHFRISQNFRVYRNVQTLDDYLDDYLTEQDKQKLRPPSSGSIVSPPRSSIFPSVRQNMNITPTNVPQSQSNSESVNSASKYEYDVAISFAGTERELAQQLATLVKDAGYSVFYDGFYKAQLWGKDLAVFFDEIYRKKSRYCAMFFSAEYVTRMWTIHERRSAIARMIEERGNEYILPIVVEHVDVPGIAPTLMRLSLDEDSVSEIAEILIEKLRHQDKTETVSRAEPDERQKRQVYKLFENESERAQNVLRDRPIGWEYLLTGELLKPRMVAVAREMDDIRRRVVFAPSRLMNGEEFIHWIRGKMNDLQAILVSFDELIKHDVPASWGPPGEPGDPIEIKRAVDRITDNCHILAAWEKDLRSIAPSDPFRHLRQLMEGWAEGLFESVQSIPDQLLAPFQQANPGGNYNIHITFEAPSNLGEANAEIQRLST